ncbi:MAG: FkbM family methyltransferase [Cyanobacteriota bacterium]|jgi:FkbM family methyltransferase
MFGIAHNTYRWIFARPRWQSFNTSILYMSLKGLGILNYQNESVSGEKYLIEKFLPGVITKKEPVFFDVGANIGDYTASLLKSFPKAKIYAFEPHPQNFSALQANVPLNQVKCYNLAVGETRGKLELYDRADRDGSSHASLHKAVISDIHKQGIVTLPVSVETLDEFCAEQGITEIDFLKIDTEGNELSVLLGAKDLLKNRKIKYISFEFNEMNVVSRVFLRDFKNLLLDFDLYRLLPNNLLPLDTSPLLTELFAYQNLLAVPKSI